MITDLARTASWSRFSMSVDPRGIILGLLIDLIYIIDTLLALEHFQLEDDGHVSWYQIKVEVAVFGRASVC